MMNPFRQQFSNRHVVLPVIHVAGTQQALANAQIVCESGADGMFLINHSIDDEHLIEIYRDVRERFPQAWIGLNCLGLLPDEAIAAVPDDVSGLWTDNAMIREDRSTQEWPERVRQIQRDRNWDGLYFGGVAFKYQRPVDDLATAARLAEPYMDVVTTSGPGTGQSAPVEKIRAMKTALGEFPLAIASGITSHNVSQYLDVADCFLVATGISRSFTQLDPRLLAILLEKVRRAGNPLRPPSP